MHGWGVTSAVATAQPEPQAAQGAPGLAVAVLEDRVYLSVAALQEGTHRRAAGGRVHAASHLHGARHRGRLGPGARGVPRQPRPGGGGDGHSAGRRVLGGGARIRARTTLGEDSGCRPWGRGAEEPWKEPTRSPHAAGMEPGRHVHPRRKGREGCGSGWGFGSWPQVRDG